MTNTFVRDVKHDERASRQSKISKTFLGRSINFYPSFYSVCGKSLGSELMLKHYYHHKDFVLSVSVKFT